MLKTLRRAIGLLLLSALTGGCYLVTGRVPASPAPPPRFAATLRLFHYAGAEGHPIEGDIAFPTGPGAPRRSPCLLFLHGRIGFWRSYRPYALQLARLGYGVLYINYYSARFVDLYEGLRPFKDRVRRLELILEDMADGVDALAAHPRCENGGVTLVGFSLGGSYAFHVAAKRPRKVKAIVSFYGGYNFGPLMNTWAIRTSYFFADRDGRRWHDWFRHQDPESLLGKIHGPILLVHGHDDTWVPPRQAEGFYALLHRRGIPTEMVLLKGMGHDFMFNLDPWGGQVAVRYLVDFLDRQVVASKPPMCPAGDHADGAVVRCAFPGEGSQTAKRPRPSGNGRGPTP